MELIAFLGEDKENWGQVSALVNRFECEKIILIKNKDAQGFPTTPKCKTIKIDSTKPLIELKTELTETLKKELSGDFEVAISLASGTGKEHMALISAALSVPVGIKIIAYTKEGIKYLT